MSRALRLSSVLIAAAALGACESSAPPPAPASTATAPTPTAQAASKPALGDFGFDTAGMDRSVAPGDDFYEYADGNWVKTTAIPADRSSYSSFTTITEQAVRDTRAILDEAAAKRDADGDAKKIGDYYAAFMDEAGISAEIDAPDGPYESVRLQMTAQNFASRQMKEIAAAPDYALGSVHAITQDGELLIGSASGSQFATVAWGADHVVLVAGLQKVVPDLETARRRVREHSLPLENTRAQEAYGQNSRLNKTLEIYGEMPGRIHLVLIRQAVGF